MQAHSMKNSIRLIVQVADEARVKTSWLEDRSTFIISLPKKTSPQGLNTAPSAFAEDLETIFEPHQSLDRKSSQNQDDDDWAELTSNADNKSLNIGTRPDAPSAHSIPNDLPSLQTLPRPEILFQTTLPYLMHVSSNGTNKVTVNGTHEPSLRLLAEYLQRWIKTDPQDIRKVGLATLC
jgi:hypothetical protein